MPGANSQNPVRIVWHGKEHADIEGSGRNMDYFVFAEPTQVEAWRRDKSIPLVDVVNSFDIFEVGNGGNTGLYERPSKQSLENTFGTAKDVDIITRILTEGKIMSTSANRHHEKDSLNRINGPPTNMSRGSYNGNVSTGRAQVHN